MDIRTFPIRLNREEAGEMAEKRGRWLRKIFCPGKALSEVRLHFIECKLITYEAIHQPSLLDRLFARTAKAGRQTITMLADGGGSMAWVDAAPAIITLGNIDQDQIQYIAKAEKWLVHKGRSAALKLLHRYAGGIPEIRELAIESVFRPYWIAFFGEVAEGKKVHYLPIAADGYEIHKMR